MLGFKLWPIVFIIALLGLLAFLYRRAPERLKSICLALFTATVPAAPASFVLSKTGACQFTEQEILQISANSQINLWGYWLVFSPHDSALAKIFIFKDSLSHEDQARLARTIKRVQTSPELHH